MSTTKPPKIDERIEIERALYSLGATDIEGAVTAQRLGLVLDVPHLERKLGTMRAENIIAATWNVPINHPTDVKRGRKTPDPTQYFVRRYYLTGGRK